MAESNSAIPGQAAIELDRALHRLDHEPVVVTAAGLKHADEIARIGDGGTQSFADRLAVGAACGRSSSGAGFRTTSRAGGCSSTGRSWTHGCVRR